MLTKKQKSLSKLKRLLRLKGAQKMSELTKKLESTIDEVRDGTCPVKTADTVHKLGHTIAQNRFADGKLQDRGMIDDETKQMLKDHEALTS